MTQRKAGTCPGSWWKVSVRVPGTWVMSFPESSTPLSVHGFIHNASCLLPFTQPQLAPNLNWVILTFTLGSHSCLSVNLVASLLVLLSLCPVPSRIYVSGSALSPSFCKERGLRAHLPYHPFPTLHLWWRRDWGQQYPTWSLSTEEDYHAFNWPNQAKSFLNCNHGIVLHGQEKNHWVYSLWLSSLAN